MDLAAGSTELARFVGVLLDLEAELRWERLGTHYCSEGGEGFFSPEQVEAIRDAGLAFAGDVAAELEDVVGARSGRSLYVGAAVAELVPALFEHLVLGREVVLQNLAGPEPEELNRALAAVERRVGAPLPRIVDTPVHELHTAFRHVWMTSVLTDPDHFPALHDALYQRTGAQAVGGGDHGQETQRARRLVRAVLEQVRTPALFTTSDEESRFLTDAAERAGMRATRPEAARLSAIVGDPIRVWRLAAR